MRLNGMTAVVTGGASGMGESMVYALAKEGASIVVVDRNIDGAYEPREFMKSSHINPEEAVAVFKDLGAKYAIAIHWGTFKLTLEKMDEPPRRLEQALENAKVSKTQFRVLQHGEFWPEVFTDS